MNQNQHLKWIYTHHKHHGLKLVEKQFGVLFDWKEDLARISVLKHRGFNLVPDPNVASFRFSMWQVRWLRFKQLVNKCYFPTTWQSPGNRFYVVTSRGGTWYQAFLAKGRKKILLYVLCLTVCKVYGALYLGWYMSLPIVVCVCITFYKHNCI